MARTLLTLPATARRGEAIEIRTLIAHPMETGYRPGENGAIQPRDLIRRLTCHYDDVLVFSAELHPAIAANPYVVFHTLALETGTLRFEWTGDHGFAQTESRTLTVA